MGPGHSAHAFIRSTGKGSFSHWGANQLYFSSSDNTNPKTNGRVYTYSTGATPPVVAEPPVDDTVEPLPAAKKYRYPASQSAAPDSNEMNLNPPAPGQSIAGDIRGTRIRGVSQPGNRHFYSKRQAWNSDESVIYINHIAYRVSDLSFIRNLRSMVSSEWYPSHINPDVIYGTSGSKLLKAYVSTGKTEIVVDVGEHILLGQWEGGISIDDRYALVDSGMRLRVVDIQNKKVISGPYTIAGEINGGDISQDGKFVSWTAGKKTYYSDIYFKNVVKTPFSTYHNDLCVDVNGDQVNVLFSGDSEIIILRLKDNFVHRKKLFSTGNGHLSCTNYKRPGWAYLSTYRGGARAIAIKLDYNPSPTFEDWGFTRQYLFNYNNYEYESLPKLSASPSGTQVILTSEWNQKTTFRDFVISFEQ